MLSLYYVGHDKQTGKSHSDDYQQGDHYFRREATAFSMTLDHIGILETGL